MMTIRIQIEDNWHNCKYAINVTISNLSHITRLVSKSGHRSGPGYGYMSISVIYIYNQVINVSHHTLTVYCHLLCQRIPIATCSRRIPYYAYYTCQSISYVIEINRRDFVHTLGGFRTYPEPRPNHLVLNQVLPLGSQ